MGTTREHIEGTVKISDEVIAVCAVNAALKTDEADFETFEEVKNKVVSLVKEKFANGNMDIVSEITEKQLGKGAKITSATEENIDALDVIFEYLTKKVSELGL